MSKYYILEVRRAEVKDLWKKGYGFKGLFTKPDLYVKVSNDNLFQRSDIVKNSTSPTWNETFPILCSEHEQKFVIEIRHDSTLDTCVGYTEILYGESKYTGGGEVRVDLRCSKDTKAKRVGSVYITLKISDARAIATLSLEKLNKIVLRVNEITDPANVILQGDLVGTIADAAPTINALVKIVDSLADAHPYLKLAWNITSLSYKVVNGQIDFDKQVKDLVAVLTGIFIIIGDTIKIRQPLESFTRATNELLDMTIRCSLLVLEYSRHEFIGRLFHVGTKEEIREYKGKLEILRGDLDSAFARQAVVIASRRADEELLERLECRLKPLYISGEDRPECLDGTRTSLIREINQWISDRSQSNILLLMGGAGTGKSTLATTVAERCRRDGRLGSYLFFLRGKSDPSSVIRTIAYRLAAFDQDIAERIDGVLREHGEITSGTLKSQFELLLHNPLHSLSVDDSDVPVLIVLDALDECGTAQSRIPLLRILEKELSTLPPKYRFLITSRPEEDLIVLKSLPSAHVIEVGSALDDTKRDVDSYIRFEFEKLRLSKRLNVPDDWPWESNLKRLSEAADGLFIWASTAIKFVTEAKAYRFRRLRELVENDVKLTLEDLYVTVLENAFQWDEDMKKIFTTVLALIFFSKTPLVDSDIDQILGLESETVADLISCLRSFISYERGHPIRIHHTSLYDYLITCRGRSWFVDVDAQREIISSRCFDVMEKYLCFNICDLRSSFIPNKDVPGLTERIHERCSRALKYICCNWAYHLRDTGYSQELSRRLELFVYNRLLFWFEILSLTEMFDDCVGTALIYAIAWLGNKNPKLSAFLRDAQMQASTYSDPISYSTPHIYSTLLPLTMNNSIFSIHYSSLANPAIQVDYTGSKLQACIKCIKQPYGSASTVSFSPDGTRLASGSGSTICIWEATSGKLIIGPLSGHLRDVKCVAFSPNGRLIVSRSSDNTIKIWDASSGEAIKEPSLVANGEYYAGSVTFSPDGRHIAAGLVNGLIILWDVESGEIDGEPFEGHTRSLTSISFSSDGLRIASGSNDNTIIVWDVESRKMKSGPFVGHKGQATSVMFSPDGRNIVSGSNDRTIRVWDAFTGNMIQGLLAGVSRTDIVNAVAYSPDGLYILAAFQSGLIVMWEASDLTKGPKFFSGSYHPSKAVSFSPDGSRFASASNDIRLWDISGGMDDTELLEVQTCSIQSIAVSHSGRYIVSGSYDSLICVWEVSSGECFAGPWKEHGSITSVDFSLDEKYVVSGSNEDRVSLWNIANGESSKLDGPLSIPLCVVFSPDGKHVASGSYISGIFIWDVESGKLDVGPFGGHLDMIWSIAYSPDGKRIVSVSDDGAIRIWDTENGNLISVFDDHLDTASCITYSPSGNHIASISNDKKLRVRDAESGEISCEIHTEHKGSVCFSPDGRCIASLSDESSISMWDAFTGDLIFGPLKGHLGPVNCMSFLPDGKRLASASGDGRIRIWSVDDCPKFVPWKLRIDNGWIVGKNDELLMWLPTELRDTLVTPGTVSILNRSFSTILDFSKCHDGDEWLKVCFLPPE